MVEMTFCSECGTEHQSLDRCPVCAGRSLMTRNPVIEDIPGKLEQSQARYLLRINDPAKCRAFLELWEHGRKSSRDLGAVKARGREVRLRIERYMKAEEKRLATLF